MGGKTFQIRKKARTVVDSAPMWSIAHCSAQHFLNLRCLAHWLAVDGKVPCVPENVPQLKAEVSPLDLNLAPLSLLLNFETGGKFELAAGARAGGAAEAERCCGAGGEAADCR